MRVFQIQVNIMQEPQCKPPPPPRAQLLLSGIEDCKNFWETVPCLALSPENTVKPIGPIGWNRVAFRSLSISKAKVIVGHSTLNDVRSYKDDDYKDLEYEDLFSEINLYSDTRSLSTCSHKKVEDESSCLSDLCTKTKRGLVGWDEFMLGYS